MVRINEIRKILKDGVSLFKVILQDSDGNIVKENEFSSYEEALTFVKNAFGGKLTRVKMNTEEEDGNTRILLEKSRGNRVIISFRRKKQTDLMSFFA